MVSVDFHKSWGRLSPGQAPYVRREKHSEFYARMDPDKLRHSERPPPEVEACFKEVFGDRAKRLKLVIHPLLHRWALYELGDDNQRWFLISVFHEVPKEGVLPEDLQGRGLDHLTGQLGEFRVPHKRDFEIIEKTDSKKYGKVAADDVYAKPEEDAEREEQRIWEDWNADWHDYTWWDAYRLNQDFESRPWSVRYIEAKQNRARYKITKHPAGFMIRERIWGEEGDRNALEALKNGEIEQHHGNTEEAADRAIDRHYKEIAKKNPRPKRTLEIGTLSANDAAAEMAIAEQKTKKAIDEDVAEMMAMRERRRAWQAAKQGA